MTDAGQLTYPVQPYQNSSTLPAAGRRIGRAGNPERDYAMLWLPADGVEVLHARFVRHSYPSHAHEAVTVALMDAGTAAFRYRNEDFLATAGQVFLLDAEAVHNGRPVDRHGYRYRVLYLHGSTLSRLLAAEAAPLSWSFRDTVLTDPSLACLLDRAHRALAGGQLRLLSEELLVRLAWALLSRYGASSFGLPGGQQAAVPTVAIAQEYLRTHFAERVSLAKLADIAGVTPYYLIRGFNSTIGISPHAYQTQLRVEAARKLLAVGTPAADVAAAAGFCDQPHLNRVFKRYTGVTPGQYGTPRLVATAR